MTSSPPRGRCAVPLSLPGAIVALCILATSCGRGSSDETRDPAPVVEPKQGGSNDDKRNKTDPKDLDDEAKKEGSGASKFARVMKHILFWEGGCSDHPADAGGRTFKGITTGRARENGWKGDVCMMPDKDVLRIYREDYWSKRGRAQPWPLDLAVMNTEVNSGGGKAQEFITRLKSQNIQGSARKQASWFVDQQTASYRAIVARSPGQGVFLKGWLNRSAYMQNVVAGRNPVAEILVWPGDMASPDQGGHAKAYESADLQP